MITKVYPRTVNIKSINKTTKIKTKFTKLIIKYATVFNDELTLIEYTQLSTPSEP
jgi:hypothetical protein